jgi:hypothetical protein
MFEEKLLLFVASISSLLLLGISLDFSIQPQSKETSEIGGESYVRFSFSLGVRFIVYFAVQPHSSETSEIGGERPWRSLAMLWYRGQMGARGEFHTSMMLTLAIITMGKATQ